MCGMHRAAVLSCKYMHVSPVFSSQPHAPLCDILHKQTMCQVFSTLREKSRTQYAVALTQLYSNKYPNIISSASVTHCLLGSLFSSPTNPTPQASWHDHSSQQVDNQTLKRFQHCRVSTCMHAETRLSNGANARVSVCSTAHACKIGCRTHLVVGGIE